MPLNARSSAVAWSTLITLFLLSHWMRALAFDWVPTEEEMAKYRKSWNPPTHGTSFTSSADVTRQGQWFVRAYVQGMIGSGESQRTATSQSVASPFSPDAVMPAATLYYGLTHLPSPSIAGSPSRQTAGSALQKFPVDSHPYPACPRAASVQSP